MSNVKYLSLINSFLFLFIFLFLFPLKNINCQNEEDFFDSYCSFSDNYIQLTDDNCFNKILVFKNTNYQVNNFGTNKNGDLVIEFIEYTEYDELSSSRLFYGLTKDGRYFFSNESTYTREFNIDIDEETYYDNTFFNFDGIYNSKNMFVTIRNAANRGNQYLFCINSYNSMVELYDLNNNDNKYHVWSFNEFFKVNEDDNDYSLTYNYELFELKKESAYIIAFIPTFKIIEELKNVKFIKKFKFSSFSENTYEEIRSVNYEKYLNNLILNIFFMDDTNTLVVLTCIENDDPPERRRISKVFPLRKQTFEQGRLRNLDYHIFCLKFYSSNLKLQLKEMILNNNYLTYWYQGEKFFIKSLYLNSKIVAFLYFMSGNDYFKFELFELKSQLESNEVSPLNRGEYLMNRNNYFDMDKSLNDFVKINNNRLAFIYTYYPYRNLYDGGGSRILEISESREICILIININKYNKNINVTDYFIDFDTYTPTMQISGFSYNGYLLLATTVVPQDGYFFRNNFPDYLSMFMIFGYANGTDSIIDISKYFYNDNPDYKNKFFWFLYKNLTIENNIFGYFPIKAIKLTFISKEIEIKQLINYDFEEGEEIEANERKIPLEETFLFCENNDNSPYCSDENENYEYDYEYIIEPNDELIKNSEYYYIDYQYIVIEFDLNNTSSEPDIYYGRANRLKFKLCHDYCETCKVFSSSDDDQKCLSCLPEYQYDYFFFSNKLEENPNICVPKGKYYNKITKKLTYCNENYSRYYVNTTNNKRICFRSVYECPPSYPIFNPTTKECFYCDFERFKNGECTAENLKMDSCTKCDYDCFKIGGCNFANFNNTKDDFYERIKNGGFLNNYNGEKGDLKVSNGNGYSFQITTLENELNSLQHNIDNKFSIIDFKDCADLLRTKNGLSPNDDLVILKYENDNQVSNGNEKSVQYEIYLPNSTTKLDLSICDNTNIIIYIPVELSEKTQKLYDSLKEQGYNLFDKNDKFYREFCTPYNSLDGTDVILPDRINDIYEKNKLECQENCEYSDYLPETKYLKCECNVTKEKKINTKDPTKITAKSVTKSFFNVLKYSNYRVLYCYNLVFRKVTIKENAGSILSNIYFIGYLIALFILYNTKASYLKTEIDKLLIDENNDKNSINNNKDNISIFQKNTIYKKENFEQEIKVKEKINYENQYKINEENNKKDENIIISKNNQGKNDVVNKDNSNIVNNIKRTEKNTTKKQRAIKSKEIKTLKDNLSENKNLASKDALGSKLSILVQEPKNIISKTPSKNESKNTENEENKNKENLSNYELNELDYEDALKLDNRNFLNIYWYLLKREHIILFTFFNWNDFNLFSIKLSKLFLSICSDMAFNVFFFSDESMHNMYESGGEYDFVGQFAQMVYSTIISQIIQIFVNYLTMTDIHYYQLKELKRENNINGKKALSVIKCIKIKLIIYIISTFLMFLFFWYAIAAFCAVYVNTQGIFVADSYLSFLMGLLYPFAIYLAPTALRILSLKAKGKKNLKILYSLSDKIPIF